MVITLQWWQIIVGVVIGRALWDLIKLLWVSYRTVMNRDYGGGWWPK